MSQDKKAPTLSDIAESAGVSLYTASVVLNGSRSNTRVSEKTRQRIQEAAARMRYHPNAMARGLIHRRAQSIGVVFGVVNTSTVLMNPYASLVLQGILSACAQRGYCVTLYPEGWLDEPRSALRFRDGRCDGLIVIAPPSDSDILSSLSSLGLNLCAIAYPADSLGLACVDVDNAKGIRLAVEHLLDLGHRRIAHITGNPNMASVPVRREAFCAAMNAAGLPVCEEWMITSRYDGEGAGEALRQLLALPEPPTALVAGNDNIAIGALSAAREMGIGVPEQLSIVGFDDAPAGAFLTPALTTVRQPLQRIGEEATRLLVAQIEGEAETPKLHLLEPELILRHSTAPLSSHSALTESADHTHKGDRRNERTHSPLSDSRPAGSAGGGLR